MAKISLDSLDVCSCCLRNWPIGIGKKKSAIIVAQIIANDSVGELNIAGSIKIAP